MKYRNLHLFLAGPRRAAGLCVFSAIIALSIFWGSGYIQETIVAYRFRTEFDPAELPLAKRIPETLTDDNSTFYYIRAMEVLDITEEDKELLRAFDFRSEEASPGGSRLRMRQIVQRNAKSLGLLHSAAAAPQLRFGLMDEDSAGMLSNVMFLARLLLGEAYLFIQDENYAAASDVVRVSGALASTLERDPRAIFALVGLFAERSQFLIIERLLEEDTLPQSYFVPLSTFLVDLDLKNSFERAILYQSVCFNFDERLFYASLSPDSFYSDNASFWRAVAMGTTWLWEPYARAADMEIALRWKEVSSLDYLSACGVFQAKSAENPGSFPTLWRDLMTYEGYLLGRMKVTMAYREIAALALELRILVNQDEHLLENLARDRRESFSGGELNITLGSDGTATVAPKNIELIRSGAICQELDVPQSCCDSPGWLLSPSFLEDFRLFEVKIAIPDAEERKNIVGENPPGQ